MALIAKTAPALTTPSLTQTRAIVAARAGTGGEGPVEGLNGTNGAQIDQAVSQFPDQQYDRSRNRQDASDDKERLPGPPRAVVRTPSEAFAALIELGDALDRGAADQTRTDSQRSDAVTVSRAVSTYEVNERVIYGTEARTGEQLSIAL